MSAFSRLQLAAALLEYDNDVSNPDAPYRSAHESAIFAHLRQYASSPPRRSTDYLGVPLPSEVGTVSGRESTMTFSHKKSSSSIHALHNPFSGAEDEDDPVKEGLEVDLTSWGLDAFMPKDKAAKNTIKQQEKSDILPNPHPVTSLRQGSGSVVEPARRRLPGSRSMSMGNFDDFGVGGAFLDAQPSASPRPRSVGDMFGHEARPSHVPFHRHRASSHVLIETLPSAPPLHSVPFPASRSRPGSPQPIENANFTSRPGSRASGQLLDDRRPLHNRTYSSNSLGSARLLDEGQNMFAIRPPSPDRASRFDPKANHARTMSYASLGTRHLIDGDDHDNFFAVRPPSPSRSSKFDPKTTHARRPSNASMGSRMLLDNDGVSMMGGASMMSGRPLEPRDRPYSTIDLLRPKVLVMPSPLQSTLEHKEPEPVRDGFHFSTDGPPLPPGARSARSASGPYDTSPVPSHLFTPNPRLSLSLSQLAFRNTLMVGGERDVAYADIDYKLPRATEEGEQMQILMEQPDDVDVPERVVLESPQVGRPAGKLFGKSLIDDLEQRKTMMRSKQRVFQGDDRPSMMARAQLQRSTTLIDPESLQQPISQHQDSFRLDRRNSVNTKPLLNFDDNKPGNKATLSPNPRAQHGRSVFGTDTLWEREMMKLKAIEAQEKLEREAAMKQEAEEAAREGQRKTKGKGRGKPKAKIPSQDEERIRNAESTPPIPVASPPTLPAISKSTAKGPPPPVNDDDTESESNDSMQQSLVQRKGAETAADRWVTESSDEEDIGPRRTTGVGPRYPTQRRRQSQLVNDDSEEDIPLAATVGRALQRARPLSGDDSDEDQPLSVMLDKAKTMLPINFDNLAVENPNDEEDDQPLGLRVSRMAPPSHALGSYVGDDDDDDKPLALHPDQQRRTQYQAMAQQQHMMVQAQMQQSMFFGAPSLMGSGFFNPSMTPMQAQMIAVPQMLPQHLPLQSPAHDPGKFGRVDRWRHDVAVEGPL